MQSSGHTAKDSSGAIFTNDWGHRFSFPMTEGADAAVDSGMNGQDRDLEGKAEEMGCVHKQHREALKSLQWGYDEESSWELSRWQGGLLEGIGGQRVAAVPLACSEPLDKSLTLPEPRLLLCSVGILVCLPLSVVIWT